MIGTKDWARLLEGLIAATEDGRLRWAEAERASSVLGFSFGAGFEYNKVQLLAAKGRVGYHLSAADGGLAPYALRVVEGGPAGKVLGVLESSTAYQAIRSGLNDQLQTLFNVARGTIEPGEEIVDRLLDGL